LCFLRHELLEFETIEKAFSRLKATLGRAGEQTASGVT
jgi:hypothetical protein